MPDDAPTSADVVAIPPKPVLPTGPVSIEPVVTGITPTENKNSDLKAELTKLLGTADDSIVVSDATAIAKGVQIGTHVLTERSRFEKLIAMAKSKTQTDPEIVETARRLILNIADYLHIFGERIDEWAKPTQVVQELVTAAINMSMALGANHKDAE